MKTIYFHGFVECMHKTNGHQQVLRQMATKSGLVQPVGLRVSTTYIPTQSTPHIVQNNIGT